jgi:hypothetical protein
VTNVLIKREKLRCIEDGHVKMVVDTGLMEQPGKNFKDC